jgi:hypothetical protein
MGVGEGGVGWGGGWDGRGGGGCSASLSVQLTEGVGSCEWVFVEGGGQGLRRLCAGG